MDQGQEEAQVINEDIVSSPTSEFVQRERGDSINVVSEPDTNEEDMKGPGQLKLEMPVENKPAIPLLVPSLRGKMTYEGGMVTCKGVWGMSDAAHSQPGQTSDFEFKLVKADEGSALFPVNGKYQGYFMLKQMAPLKGSIKVEDKEMIIHFNKTEADGVYEIQGKGINKFGSFTLRGTLQEDGSAHMYREYYNLTPTPLPASVKRRMSMDGDEAPKSARKAPRISTDGAAAAAPPPPEISPRESSGRVRKQSSAMKEYMDMQSPRPPPTPKAPAPPVSLKIEPPVQKQPKSAPVAAPSSSSSGGYGSTYGLGMPLIRHESTSDRAQRAPPYLKKCSELLKEMSKHVQAQWFLEPVDPVKLNIPEYPSIISNPMDFSTIRKKIDNNVYGAVEAFAEDMRLVFRNAMTFNVSKESLVHIAARDMSQRFEDRYRVMVSQLQGVQAYSSGAILDLELKTPRQSLGGAGSSKKPVGASKTPRVSLSGKVPGTTPGPRVTSAGNLAGLSYLPPAADGSAHQFAEMQRMMAKMQNEMDALRAQVRNNETAAKLKDHQDAAHNPLSFEEKKNLIAQIHRLPPESLEHVLEIIQSVMPPRDDNGDDIEIPLDALDTATLRRLQKYVESRPRPAPVQPAPMQRQASSSGATKRARKSTSSAKLASGTNSVGLSGGSSSAISPLGVDFQGADGDLPLLDEDDLLFAADSFEELKSNAQRMEQDNNSSGAPHAAGDLTAMGGAMDDDEDFASLAALHNSGSINSDNIHLGNSDAWNQ